ncbi:MAG TPA: hypothetical protein VNI57_04085 [Candidatus Saccharimonadales bacterium]|nr:hypothetical protein [Candidatus Saccharimonadales bacterium]
MGITPERIQLLHPERGKSAPRIDKGKYDAVRKAILRAVPANAEGITWRELPGKVRALLPPRSRSTLGSVTWYTVSVKLDMEARGELERIPGAVPQRIRRRRQA